VKNSDCSFGHIQAKYNDQHLMGSIASARLSIHGYVTMAYLQYQDLRDPTKWGKLIKHHNIFSYGLQIQGDLRLLEFYTDYILCLEGEKWLAPGGKGLFTLY
jgi:hypothetical protein